MSPRRRVTSPRLLAFVALLALAALGAAAALTLWPAAGKTASAQGSGSLQECHNLYLDMDHDDSYIYLNVTNLNDEETIANVMVETKSDSALNDDHTSQDQTSQWGRVIATIYGSAYGTTWTVNAPQAIHHWLLPAVPPRASYQAKFGSKFRPAQGVQFIRRNTVTVEQRVPGSDTALCSTVREFWTRSTRSSVKMFSSVYKIGELSVDNPYPAPGGNVNFKVVGDSQDSVSALVKVQHTSGLEFQPNSPAVIKPEPTGGRTSKLAMWRNYDAATGVGEFYIGNEGIQLIATQPEISLTLPLKLKSGVKADGQCVTATITAMPKLANPNNPGENYDDPSDNTATLCLGAPTDGPPLLQHGDHVDLLSLYFCDGNTKQTGWDQDPTTHPCNNTQATDLGMELATEHLAGGFDWQVYSAPASKVNAVVKLDPVRSALIDTSWQSVNTWCDATQDVTNTNCTGGKGVWVQNSSRISFATARDVRNHHNEVIGHTYGPQLHWTIKRMDNQFSNWGTLGRLMSVSGLPAGGFSAIPDQYGTTCITVNNGTMPSGLPTLTSPPGGMNYRGSTFIEFRQRPPEAKDYWSDLNRPRHKRWNWTITNITYDNNSYERIAEFTNLGTYVVDYHYSLTRSSGAARYCDTLRTVFHVGPIAELSVADGDDVPALASGQRAYTLDLANLGPDAAEAAKVVVKLPASATGVATVPANLGTFLAAANADGANPYWIYDIGKMPSAGFFAGAGQAQSQVVSLIVTGVTSADTATATISNGNYHCASGNSILSYVTSEADCKLVTGATWTMTNPYKLCLVKEGSEFRAALPTPASKTACEATTGNKWYAGTVLDHRQGNNTATLTARTAAGAGLSGSAERGPSRPTVVLNWPSATAASQYRIFRSADGKLGSYRQIKRVDQNTLTYTDAADVLKENDTYYYQVEALYPNKRLADIYATSITATLKARSPHAPYSVSGLKAARTADNENIIAVTWTAPGNATAATRYDVQYQTRTGNTGNYGDWTAAATEQAGLAYTITGAGGGTSYRIQVRAVNVVGADSYESGWSTATVLPVSAPGQVGNLQARRTNDNLTNIIVSWDKPSSGATPDGYDVQYRENNGDWQTAATKQAGLTYPHNNAKGASTYQFRVRTVIESGSDDVPGSWRTTGPVSKVPNPGTVTGLTAGRSGADETKIGVTWTAPSGGTAPSGYEAAYRVNSSGDWLTTNLTVTGITAELTGASGNSTYQFRVRGVKTLTHTNNTVETLAGSWRTTGTVSKVSAPNRVTGLTATRQSDDEAKIDVAWTAPSSGTSPSGYDVEYKQDGGDWTTGTTVNDPTTVTHTFDVQGGSSYQYRVRAFRTLITTNEKLAGSWTNSSTVRGLPAGPVTNLAATRNDTDKTTIDVSWSASNRATGYDVQYRKNTGSWQWGARAANQTGTTYTQTDAGGVETYTFRVRGVSSVGNGDWTESDEVGPPPLEWQGYAVGPTVADGKMAWIELKMTSGPWWYEYRNHVGDWSSCKRVAAGSHTISNLRAPITYIVEIFDAAGCDNGDRIRRENITTVDVQDTILDGTDPNNHTHKRQYPRLGVLGEGDCASDRMWHSHGWPNSGNWYGQHWHCQVYR